MTDLTALAEGLTEAQRREMKGEVRSIGNPERFVLCGDITERRMLPTLTKLTKLGLIEQGRFGKTMLTPLGLALRAHLLKGNGDATA